MRLKYEFETMELMDQIIAIPVGDSTEDYHEAIKLNGTAAFIFDLLKEETTVEAIVDRMEKEYDAPRETIEKDVRNNIAQFEKKGLIIG